MSRGRLSELAGCVGGVLGGADAAFAGVCTDTRRLSPGELFVALRGPNFDGHDFLPLAARTGAAGAMVERVARGDSGRRGTPAAEVADADFPMVIVDDTRRALGRYANAWRRRFSIPLIAVTGSNGKTTVKEMIGAILACRGPALVTRGNLNNDIGLPLTLLELDATHRSAVVEMGANHPGEIAGLTRIAEPVIGLVNNAGPAHLEGFGDLEGVARAKGELFAGLAADATAIINADDPYCDLWRELAGRRRQVLFGRADSADVRLLDAAPAANGEGIACTLQLDGAPVPLTVPLVGEHNALNAAAAAAATLAAGMSTGQIVAGLSRTRALSGRLRVIDGARGARIVDDAYNANPLSARAAVDYLARQPGRGWLVLGDMGELGPGGPAMHAELGRYARAAGIEALFAVGPLSREAAAAFGDGGSWHADVESLIADVARELCAGVTVLVKGSRAMHLERVVAALGSRHAGEVA